MSVRRVLVLGATGGTGRHVVEQAAATGLELTALVRNPSRLSSTNPAVRAVTGDLLIDSPAVRSAFAGQDAVISALGVGSTWQDTPLVPRLFASTLLRDVYADKTAGEAVIKESGLDWTIVYPASLTNGPATGSVRVGERLRLSGFPRVSRADVAAVLRQQLDDRRFIGKGILVAG